MGYHLVCLEHLDAYRIGICQNLVRRCQFCNDYADNLVEELASPVFRSYPVCDSHLRMRMLRLELLGFQALPFSVEFVKS